MTDYYEPTFLFRQNAIKRFSPTLSPISSVESLSLIDSNSINHNSSIYSQPSNSFSSSSSSSWLLNPYNDKDTAILNQSCCLNRTNVKSNYWKIPDESMNLTSMSINKNQGGNPILAISSGKCESNLFIYELNLFNNHLIHHHTISLPNIYAMKWINNTRYLVTGNNKGYAHLVSTPKLATNDVFNRNSEDNDDYEDGDGDGDGNDSAEICKRFNHRKYLKQNQLENTISTPIRHLNFLNNHENLLSIYNDYLFYWDIKGCHQQTRPSPISISTVSGIKNFDVLENNNNNNNNNTSNTVAICGLFGVSLFDLRDCHFNIPNYAQTQTEKQQSYRKLSANIVKWNPINTNILAAGHGDGVVRLWDIRKQDSYIVELYGHNNYTTSMEWNNNNDLFTGSKDGNIIHWDLSSIDFHDQDYGHDHNNNHKSPIICGLKEGFDSIEFNPKANQLQTKLDQHQCGTILPASNSSIVAMCSTNTDFNEDNDEEIKILSIDSSSFLGVHNKISESINVNINTNKLYYTEEDIQLLLQSQLNNNNNNVSTSSNDTLVTTNGNNASQDSLVKPLTISRKPTTKINSTTTTTTTKPTHNRTTSIDESIVSVHNVSNDTLVNSPTRSNICESEDEFTFNVNSITNKDQNQGQNISGGCNNRHSSFSSVSSQQTQLNDSTESLSTVVTDIENEINHHEQKYLSLLLPIEDTTTTITKENNNSDIGVINTAIIST